MRTLGLLALAAVACGGDHTPPPDAGNVITTDKCNYVPLVPTAHAGGTVAAAPLMAGAADRVLDIPVGTALGGYTARAGFLGSAPPVDTRQVKMSGAFNASIGVETAPRVKAVALTAGDETALILKVDVIYIYEGMVYDLEQRLGPQYAGKIILASSHSHSAWSQHYYSGPLQLGSSVFRQLAYDRFLDAFEAAANDALAARRPAKLGVFADENFDPMNYVNHDRRDENNMLPGGNEKDHHLRLIRIDGTDNVPIAAMVIFGEHGTLNDSDNPLASTDAPGALERALQEQFDSKVVVMHMQSAGGDNSPNGWSFADCNVRPSNNPHDPCFAWTTVEGHGRAGAPILLSAWQSAGAAMKDTLELSMISESIELGPKPETFAVRGGALTYAPWDGVTLPDKNIYDDSGAVISPIDEFNAPVGAGLCQSMTAMFPAATIPGDDNLYPYGSCLRMDTAAPILGQIFQVDLGVDDTSPVCETTRTTITALRIGDYVLGTMPGELTVLLADYLRSKSPVAADHTILVGYSQGHIGYMLTPEDWLTGGYEPSITFWGPLESEYIANKLLALMPMVLMPSRQDASTVSTTRVAVPTVNDGLDIDNPAQNAGTVPATVPTETWARTGTPAQAQPAATIERISGIATFVWIGDDPNVKTPHVTLQFETSPGTFTNVTRRSGRVVEDGDFTVAYTPVPLQRTGPQTHVWVAEWQAVPWLGAPGLDSMDQRGGVPLGKYRFHVEGQGWTLDSHAFQVVPGGLVATASRGSSGIAASASWSAPKGWRLMVMSGPSNQPVPLVAQTVTVSLLSAAGATLSTTAATTDPTGKFVVTNNASAASMKVTDPFGNSATVAIQ